MTSLNDGELIHISVIDIWSLLLIMEEKYLAWSNSSQQKKFFFNCQFSLYLENVLRLKCELMRSGACMRDAYDDSKTSLRGCWEYYLDRLKLNNVMMSADLVFFPIHSKDHYFLVVIDFPQKTIHYCDNREYVSVTDTNYWQLMIVLRDEFSAYLKQIGHPKAPEMKFYDLVEVQFEWKKEARGVDCGVFVMHNMQNFNGYTYSDPELMKGPSRRKFRALYCARIALTCLNELRFDIQQRVRNFVSRPIK